MGFVLCKIMMYNVIYNTLCELYTVHLNCEQILYRLCPCLIMFIDPCGSMPVDHGVLVPYCVSTFLAPFQLS